MLGYMNRDALAASLASGRVTFFSRSKQRLWVKGESSGNHLALVAVAADCDRDTLLVTADPAGPTCHLGTLDCFGDAQAPFIPSRLAQIVESRAAGDGYTASLMAAGLPRIAQKVGEEGVEVALAAVTADPGLAGEAADLVYHLSVLLHATGTGWDAVLAELERRHR
jgi:phosphoribosyl-ATP pyrophosphohydrolase/phosphoribosyl-AMP cyclohydrolase